jgi:exodeoxyribonuclease VII small subunit
MMNEKPNYVEAFQELQKIVAEIESGLISVDELSEKVRRATDLIRICKMKLSSTEDDVNKILKDIESLENER